ncbi:unnamed protein product [Hermetia illucens]|uniref:Uncharacterized protein n=1 Tax=Hermetia illucens TaxID=343691 RepID=A0A7R8YX22_HERIL|nr:unnamed protein product [Hermetia illucens]
MNVIIIMTNPIDQIIIKTNIIIQNRLDKTTITDKTVMTADGTKVIPTIQVIIKDKVPINQVKLGLITNLHNDSRCEKQQQVEPTDIENIEQEPNTEQENYETHPKQNNKRNKSRNHKDSNPEVNHIDSQVFFLN